MTINSRKSQQTLECFGGDNVATFSLQRPALTIQNTSTGLKTCNNSRKIGQLNNNQN